MKSSFKKNGSNFDKSMTNKKDQTHRKSKSDAKKIAQEMFKNNNRNYKTNPKLRKSNYIDNFLNEKLPIPKNHEMMMDKESPINLPQSYILGQINQNWIENINQQIEENGKSLLDSINKAKKKNSSNMMPANRKNRTKNRPARPQSTHYVNIPNPHSKIDSFHPNHRIHSELMKAKPGNTPENLMMFDPSINRHNKSCNQDSLAVKPHKDEPDLTHSQIALNHK